MTQVQKQNLSKNVDSPLYSHAARLLKKDWVIRQRQLRHYTNDSVQPMIEPEKSAIKETLGK